MSRMFSRPVSSSSTVAAWPVSPMLRRTASGSRDDVVAGHPPGAARRRCYRRQHPHGRGLAGAVGAEQPEDRARGTVKLTPSTATVCPRSA